MEARRFSRLAGAVFAAIALAHLVRLATGASVTVLGAELPLWVNAVAAVVGGGLAWLGLTAR